MSSPVGSARVSLRNSKLETCQVRVKSKATVFITRFIQPHGRFYAHFSYSSLNLVLIYRPMKDGQLSWRRWDAHVNLRLAIVQPIQYSVQPPAHNMTPAPGYEPESARRTATSVRKAHYRLNWIPAQRNTELLQHLICHNLLAVRLLNKPYIQEVAFVHLMWWTNVWVKCWCNVHNRASDSGL
jgi:hypothetical protein